MKSLPRPVCKLASFDTIRCLLRYAYFLHSKKSPSLLGQHLLWNHPTTRPWLGTDQVWSPTSTVTILIIGITWTPDLFQTPLLTSHLGIFLDDRLYTGIRRSRPDDVNCKAMLFSNKNRVLFYLVTGGSTTFNWGFVNGNFRLPLKTFLITAFDEDNNSVMAQPYQILSNEALRRPR